MKTSFMKTRTPIAFLVLLTALAPAGAHPALGRETVEDVVKRAPSRGKFPQAIAAVVKEAQTMRLDGQGNASLEGFRVVEVFNLTGREKFSDFRIPLDKRRESLEVLLARTYKGDLTYIEVEKGAVNDVTPPHLADADMYADIVHRVLSFQAVNPGSCLAVRFLKTTTDAPGDLSAVVLFQDEEPIQEHELRIVLPPDKNLKYKIIGLKEDFREETSDRERIYTLTVSNAAAIKPEEYMPPLAEVAARAVFSTWPGWDEAARRFSLSFEAAAKPDPRLAALAAELTKAAAAPDEKIRRLFLFVATEVRNVALPFGEGGYEVHEAGTVLANRYGDWKDKSALLTALLRSAGFEAQPVLANSRSIPIAEDVPCLEQFDCVLVAVSRGGDLIFLNPFARDSRFGYLSLAAGSRGLMVKPGAAVFQEIKNLPGTESVSRNGISGELDARGNLRGKISSAVAGVFDRWARRELKDKTEKERRDFFAEALNRIHEDTEAGAYAAGDLKDLTRPVEVGQEFLARDFGLSQGKVLLLYLPDIPYEFAGRDLVPRLDKRTHALRLPDTMDVSLSVKIKVPKDYKLLYLPEGFSVEKEYGRFMLAASFDPKKSELRVERKYSLTQRDIPPERYEEFKALMDAFSLPRNTLVLMEKK
ncbi:MAG: hypothetical protein A2Y86_05950 [Candidatus Aminicenantes bacterium RBG_13_62_12]|nr:MAG: hypothetical protein A2Y86_05950 [Candidatus Aminicenantes bacterium RBG_13_62_12]